MIRSGRTMKGQKKQERRIVEITRAMEAWLNLEYIDIRIAFNREPDNEGDDTACETHSQWEYSQATMTWNMDAVVGIRRKQLEELVLHELVHVVMGPIQEFIPSKHVAREEKVTEDLARILMRQYRGKPIERAR